MHHTKVLFTFTTLRKRSLFPNVGKGLCRFPRSTRLPPRRRSPSAEMPPNLQKPQTPRDRNLAEGTGCPHPSRGIFSGKDPPVPWRGTKRLWQSGSRHAGKAFPQPAEETRLEIGDNMEASSGRTLQIQQDPTNPPAGPPTSRGLPANARDSLWGAGLANLAPKPQP